MNIEAVLKSEITRIARKELRSETLLLKKTNAQHRADIASLKRRLTDLERKVRAVGKPTRAPAVVVDPANTPLRNRFSPKGLASGRQRLGLSAVEMGALVGVSGQSIYKWEQEKATPRASQLPVLRAVLKIGKREAAAKLAAIA